MSKLVMDGVIRPSQRPVEPASVPAPSPETLVNAVVSGPTVDGLRRFSVTQSSEPVSPTVSAVSDALLRTASTNRYQLAALATVSAALPALVIASHRILPALTAPQAVASQAAAAAPVAEPKPAPAPVVSSAVLQKLVGDFAAGQSAPMGLVVKNLKTGEVAQVTPAKPFVSASLYKLFVATTIFRQIDTGKLSYGSATGIGRNVEDCLNLMITISDNDCGRALGSMIGWGKADASLHTLGFTNTTLADQNNYQMTSAGDVALLFERLYNGTLLSPSSTEHFLDLLKSQQVNNRLPVGLPGGTTIAHKTGDLDGYVHDAGIVYSPKADYVIVAVTGPWDAWNSAPPAISKLSQQVYQHFNQ